MPPRSSPAEAAIPARAPAASSLGAQVERTARSGAPVALAAAIGAVGWSGVPELLPASLALPVLWSRAKGRRQAAAIAAAYVLAASRGLPEGAATYFGAGMATGVSLWILASSATALAYGLAWSRARERRPLGFALATLTMAVPPLGVVGWASPWTAAGMIAPGLGLFGLSFTVLLASALAHARLRRAALVALVIAWSFGLAFGDEPRAPEGWRGIGSQVDYEPGAMNFGASFAMLEHARRALRSSDAAVTLLPEGAVGWRTDGAEAAWRRLAGESGAVLLAGVEHKAGEGSKNALARIDGERFEIPYTQRMPVPVSMWRPWSAHSTHASILADPVVAIEGRRVAALICYEQLLVWPVLHSAVMGADAIIALSNLWWARGTSIPAIQEAATIAWARLFALDLVMAVNR